MKAVAGGVAAVGALLFPFFGQEGYFTHLAITMLIFSILASSLNLMLGYAGLVSVAHGAFFGIGAYASGALMLRYGLPFWAAFAGAAVVTALVALAIGLPSFRTRGIYYVIVTVAFQLIATEVFNNWHTMTGGGVGMKGIPRPSPLLQSRFWYYYLALGAAVVVHWLIARVIRSPLGVALMAIRDNETKAMMMGVPPLPYKTIVFVLAAALAGLAGSLYAHYMEYAHPDFFNFFVSVDVYLMVILGGAGTVHGPAVGVLIVELIREGLHEFTTLRLLLFGLLLIVVINFLPGGLVPPVLRWLGRTTRAP